MRTEIFSGTFLVPLGIGGYREEKGKKNVTES